MGEYRTFQGRREWIIIQIYTMQSGHQRPHSQPLPKKRSASGDIEEYEHDGRVYRSLLAFLADNVNVMIRAHRDCLGEMELQPKIKVSKEEQSAISQNLQKIYQKEQEKISKEALNRNSEILKNYEQFYNLYKSSHPQRIETNGDSTEGHFRENSRKTISKNYQTLSAYRRPLSSKGTKVSNFISINQVFTAFNNQIGQIYKMKTIEGRFSQNPEAKNEKRLIMSTQRGILREQLIKAKRGFFARQKEEDEPKRYHNLQENTIFNGSQIIICDRRPKEQVERQNACQSGKIIGKRMISMKYGHRKSIDEIERMQIESRINMASSVLAVGAPQSQGYRPKSKCWQNYFN